MNAIPLADRETAVYRLFDVNKTLLYVGISCDPNERLKDHEAQKPWWPDVDHIKVVWRRNRAEAFRAEAWAIATEVPLHNDWRPDPRRFGVPDDLSAGLMKQSRLSVGEAAKHLHVPAVELFDAARAGFIPHNRAGSKIWFTASHVKALENRMTAKAIAVAGDFMANVVTSSRPLAEAPA